MALQWTDKVNGDLIDPDDTNDIAHAVIENEKAIAKLTPIERTHANVETLEIEYPEAAHFELWIALTTAASGTIAITFPTGTKFIVNAPIFGNGEQWEISVKDGVAVCGKVSE